MNTNRKSSTTGLVFLAAAVVCLVSFTPCSFADSEEDEVREQLQRQATEAKRRQEEIQQQFEKLQAELERSKADAAEQRERAEAQKRLAEQRAQKAREQLQRALEAQERAKQERADRERSEREESQRSQVPEEFQRRRQEQHIKEVHQRLRDLMHEQAELEDELEREESPAARGELAAQLERTRIESAEVREHLANFDHQRQTRMLELLRQRIEQLADQGRTEEAERLELRAREIARHLEAGERESGRRRSHAADEHRIDHLRQAIEHLHEAGIHDVAEELAQRLRRLDEHGDRDRRPHEHDEDLHHQHEQEHHSHEDRHQEAERIDRAFREIHHQLDQMRREMEEMKKLLREATNRR